MYTYNISFVKEVFKEHWVCYERFISRQVCDYCFRTNLSLVFNTV